MEYFQNTDFEKGSRECMTGQSSDQWTDCGQQVFPCRTDKWPGDGNQNMGGGKEKRAATGYGKKTKDPFGLRDILVLG